MFIIKERKYPIIKSQYKLSRFGELMNDTFDGGEQIFLDRNNKHIFVDMNKETFECYSINIILAACNFSVINYSLTSFVDATMYFKKQNHLNESLICEDFDLKCYVDYKNKLVIIGDISVKGNCYQFFKDTFCILSNNTVKLLFIKVDDDVLEYIRSK